MRLCTNAFSARYSSTIGECQGERERGGRERGRREGGRGRGGGREGGREGGRGRGGGREGGREGEGEGGGEGEGEGGGGGGGGGEGEGGEGEREVGVLEGGAVNNRHANMIPRHWMASWKGDITAGVTLSGLCVETHT